SVWRRTSPGLRGRSSASSEPPWRRTPGSDRWAWLREPRGRGSRSATDPGQQQRRHSFSSRSFASPSASRLDHLTVETELVTPILAVERPNHVFFVGFDHAEDLRFRLAHLIGLQLLVE